jgi:hypothetical protein
MSNRLTAPRPTWRGAPMLYTVRKLGLTANLRLCLDAGDDASYASGQPWLDTSGNGYDFFRGADGSATGTDPTFNGTAGGRSSSEYWSFDGGDYFTYDTTNETWMQNLHKDSALFTIVTWWYRASTDTSSIMGTNGGGANVGTGFHLIHNSGPVLLRCLNATAAALDVTLSTVTVPATTWAMLALSINEAAGAAGGTWFCNGASETFNAAYSSPASGNASQTLQIGARGGGNNPAVSGSRCASFLAWEGRALTIGEIQALFQATRGRFGA